MVCPICKAVVGEHEAHACPPSIDASTKPPALDSVAAANAMSGPPALYVREARLLAREILAECPPGTLPFKVCLLWRLAELVEAAYPELAKEAGA